MEGIHRMRGMARRGRSGENFPRARSGMGRVVTLYGRRGNLPRRNPAGQAMTKEPCPSRDNLERMLDSRLSDLDRAAVETHVRDCADCRQTMRQLEAHSD